MPQPLMHACCLLPAALLLFASRPPGCWRAATFLARHRCCMPAAQAMLIGMCIVLWWQLRRRNQTSKGGLGTLLSLAADRAKGCSPSCFALWSGSRPAGYNNWGSVEWGDSEVWLMDSRQTSCPLLRWRLGAGSDGQPA